MIQTNQFANTNIDQKRIIGLLYVCIVPRCSKESYVPLFLCLLKGKTCMCGFTLQAKCVILIFPMTPGEELDILDTVECL